ncbi:CRACD-like protein isoform X1 [Delphinus delphis]|uniref:CRACD-like protein isoform X1 n=1 Tax=Delphinus delphis TaxID=9728 RepID=UPI0028C51012|nr:CRACD-like protein isoform X1 [Delphinus delphis]XP_059883659.1 CRACD-like protein isoform X1 [Delphinus delphis]
MISTRVMDIKLREAAEGLGEDSTGKKKSKFKTFKKFFGKKKRKESPSSTGSSTWKQSQAKSEVIAIESGPVGYDSEDELDLSTRTLSGPSSQGIRTQQEGESRGTLGSRALSHDSIFIPESGQDPPRPVRVFSQENVCDRIKALQLKIQCNVKMGLPPPPGGLPARRGDDAGMSSEDDGLPRSPPEMSLLHDIGPGTTIKVCVVSSSRPQSPDQLFSRQVSDTSVSPRTSDGSVAPVADFDYPPEFSSCLDNSAAKHKLLVKPRNQRCSKMRRLSSRAQSESLSDLTCTPEEEEYDEKPLPKVSTEEKPSSGQQEGGQDRGAEPGGQATMLPPVGPRARRARLQHCPAFTASTEDENPQGENPSSLLATPEVMEVTEPVSSPHPRSESPSCPEGSPHPHPNPDNENPREELSLETRCPPGGDTADEVVCASGDVEGRLSPCIPEGDTTPPEPGPIATWETPSGPNGPDHTGPKEVRLTLDAPGPEGAGPAAPAPSPPAPKSCLKHKASAATANANLGAAPSPPASASPAEAPAPRSLDQEAAPPEPPRAEREGSPTEAAAPERKMERGGREARAAKKFSVSSGREWPRAGGRLLEPRGPAVRLPLLRSGPAWKSEAALEDLPAPAEPQGLKPGPRKPPAPAERGSPDAATADPGPAARERPAGGDGSPFPVKLRSTSLSFKHREAPCPEGRGIKRYSAEVRLEKGGLTLLSRNDKGPPGTGPAARGARSPNEPGKAKTRSTEQLSSKPPLPRKPLLQTLTLPQLPAPPDASPRDPEKVGPSADPRKESQAAERRSPHRAAEKAAGPGTDGQPAPPWITVGRQKRRGAPEQPSSQEDKPGAGTLKSDTGRPAKAPERTQESMKQADFVRSKSFLMAPAKPTVDQRQGTKLHLQEGLQRGISLSHQNLAAQSAVMMEKELHQLKRASYASTDQPSWMELARKKSQAWSDMPQIIK